MTVMPRAGFQLSHAMEIVPVVPTGTVEGERTWTSFVHADLPDSGGYNTAGPEFVPIDLMEPAVKKFIMRGGPVIDGHTNKIRGRMVAVERVKHPDLGVDALRARFVAYQEYHGDDRFWERLKAGAYTGMSWGGDAVKIVDHCMDDACRQKVGLYVEPPEIYEFSVVDVPANPGATLVEVNERVKGHVHRLPAVERAARQKGDCPCADKTKGFGGYTSFADCVAQNQDKDDPNAYCGTIQAQVEKQKGREVGGFESPEPGDIPEADKQVLARVYATCRKDHPDYPKEQCAKIAWGAVRDGSKDRQKAQEPSAQEAGQTAEDPGEDGAAVPPEPEGPEGQGLSGATVASTPALEDTDMTPEEQARIKALEDENARIKCELETRRKADQDARWSALEARVKAAEEVAAAAKAKADAYPPAADDKKEDEEKAKAEAAEVERVKVLEADLEKAKASLAARAKGSVATTPRPHAAGTVPGGEPMPSQDAGASRQKAAAVSTKDVAQARSFGEVKALAFKQN